MSDLGGYGLRVIREALENLLEEGLASTVLLEALGRLPDDDELPQTAAELTAFVDGQLLDTLGGHVSASQADATIQGLRRILTTALRSREQSAAAGGRRARKRPSQQATMSMANATDSLRLLIIAGSNRLLQKVEAAVGTHRVTGITCGNEVELARYVPQLDPHLVIVDGADPAEVVPATVAESFGKGSRQLVLWAAEQPWGNLIHKTLEQRTVRHAPVPRSAGLETLLDYIRARSV